MKKKWVDWAVIPIYLYIWQFQLTYSATIGIKNNLMIALPWVLLNMLIVALPFWIGLVFVKKVKWAILMNSVLITILSLINYHVLLFHGSPFLAGDIFSIPTAVNVLSEYSMVLDSIVSRLLVLFVMEVVLWVVVWLILLRQEDKTVKRGWAALLGVVNLVVFAILFLSPYAVFTKNLVSWSWATAMNQYGYSVCFGNSLYVIRNFYAEPDNYDADLIVCEESDELTEPGKRPDIVLILNETLADLDVYLDLKESRQIFSELAQIEGMVSGYTVSSLIGGGTNNSEYELLTSNSMQMLNVSAPFASLDMTNANSIVSYLNDLNYTTVGMHCGNASNYNRNRAYPDVGFDQIYLGRAAFTYDEYENRPWQDSDNYRDLIEWYESCGDEPRFLYLLTYQNHGGYEQNSAQSDTVSVSGSFGEYTDDINEYLTSIGQSVDAFLELIRYFEKTDRPVVLMMLGDHGPAFLADLPTNRDLSPAQQEIAKRTVPFYVWSNQQLNRDVFSSCASMVDLMPLLLRAADMPLTGYYKEILKLHREVPVRTSTGLFVAEDGSIGNILPESRYYDRIQNYYYLEYSNLVRGDDYDPARFELTEE